MKDNVEIKKFAIASFIFFVIARFVLQIEAIQNNKISFLWITSFHS